MLDKFNFESNSNSDLFFIPENLAQVENSNEFIYSDTTTDLNKTLKKDGLKINFLTDDKPLLRSRKNAEWFGPSILVGYTILTQNPQLIDLTMSILSSYLYDLFKGVGGTKKVKFDIIIESKSKKNYKQISYEGNIEGIKELNNVIKTLEKWLLTTLK